MNKIASCYNYYIIIKTKNKKDKNRDLYKIKLNYIKKKNKKKI